MYRDLKDYIQALGKEVSEILDKRKLKLEKIADYIQSKNRPKLNFICTHNSRRSHLCQIWAATFASQFGLENVQTFSGGTEATAFSPRAVETVRRAGFTIENPGGENPRCKVWYNDEKEPLICFSKTFDDLFNPQEDFVAVMTCSDADLNCPVVPGASIRFSIPYVDPKEADGTPEETKVYEKRCRQIASEMYYMLSQGK